MKELNEKKKKIIVIVFVVIIIMLIAGIIACINIYSNSELVINKVHNENYSFQYDNTWKIIDSDNMQVELLHKKSNSELNIKLSELKDELQYKAIDELFDSLLYNVQEQNKNYKLIYKEQNKITKDDIDGYKILFETEAGQALIYFYKQGNKVAVITYEAENDYFDILLDSVNSIVYNFGINEQTFNVLTNININTSEVSFSTQDDIKGMLKDTKDDEIAASNYLVKYSIPSNFKSKQYDTKYGSYEFENLETGNSISLKTSIFMCNLYEYLDRDEWPNIYTHNINSYSKNTEQLQKYGEEPACYIFKNDATSDYKIRESITIVFEVNKNHIFIAEISSEGVGIPKELVDMIKINEVQNIASNIRVEKENGLLIGSLKRFTDYTYEKTEEIKLKLPENFVEEDKDNNLYEKRNYSLQFNEEMQNYEYEASYEIFTMLGIDYKLESLGDMINKNLRRIYRIFTM